MPMQIVLIVIVVAVLLVIARSLRVAAEWQRAVVLRLGRFHRVKGPGIYLVYPASTGWRRSSTCASRPPRSPPSRH